MPIVADDSSDEEISKPAPAPVTKPAPGPVNAAVIKTAQSASKSPSPAPVPKQAIQSKVPSKVAAAESAEARRIRLMQEALFIFFQTKFGDFHF